MTRTTMLYLAIGALSVAVVVLGYQVYESRQGPQGVDISIGAGGISIEER